MPLVTRHGSAVTDNDIYLHEEAATEPNTDDSINATTFSTDTEDTYSNIADPPGYIMSFTSEAGIFTEDQDFDDHNTKWTLKWNAKYAGTPPIGTTAFIRFEFYKRNASNSDTKLFDVEPSGFSTLKSFTGNSYSFTPTGSVLTTDRLRIRVYIGSAIPT